MVKALRGRARWTAAASAGALAALVVSTMPVGAVASAGGGTLDGTVSFTQGSIPPIFQGCNQVAWQFSSNTAPVTTVAGQPVSTTNGAVLAINDSTFAGSMTINASGNSGTSCETTQGGSGNLTVNYTFGQNVTGVGQFTCGTLAGSYVREASIVELNVQGNCSITGSNAAMIAETVVELNAPPPNLSSGQIPGVNQSVSSVGADGAWVDATT